MKYCTIPLLFAFMLTFLCALPAQQWSVHLQLNEYYPLNSGGKGYYPMLWYSGEDDRGVLLGGFGGGVSWSKALNGNWNLKAQANFGRSRYYAPPVLFVDENGQSLGFGSGITTSLNISALVVPRYRLSGWVQLGLGLGAYATPVSKSDYGSIIFFGEKRTLKYTDKSNQPLILTLPVEFVFQPLSSRFSLTWRVEPALTRVSRLPFATGERFLLSILELGWRLGPKAE